MEFREWIDLFLSEYERITELDFNHNAVDSVKEIYYDNGWSYNEAVLEELLQDRANNDFNETIKKL